VKTSRFRVSSSGHSEQIALSNPLRAARLLVQFCRSAGHKIPLIFQYDAVRRLVNSSVCTDCSFDLQCEVPDSAENGGQNPPRARWPVDVII
jgi:hypothetical protein